MGFAELLQEEDGILPDQELRQHLRKIVDNGLRVTSIADELLTVRGTHSAELVKVTREQAGPGVGDYETKDFDHIA